MQRLHLPLSLMLLLVLSAWPLPSSAATEIPPASSLPGRESLPPAAMTEADTALLDKIQRETFGYFWDFAHPDSGLARERSRSNDVVTSGGSGFGVMAILVATERGWITRPAAIDRLQKMVGFLETADRFHGAWPHWLDGRNGTTIPFSPKDDGADLVETAYLVQGLLTAGKYFDRPTAVESQLRQRITRLWEAVEWDWFTQDEPVLYWHWSPNYEFQMNHRIQGWNECLITYVLAAASPTHPIKANVYHQGWARSGEIVNREPSQGLITPLGRPAGGPLFFAHYSFLGLDPRQLTDRYANYWHQNVTHSLVNYRYCVSAAKPEFGYRRDCWGLTASDDPWGYSAHQPGDRDNGTITPSAALSSLPYAPRESLAAARYFDQHLDGRLWGPYGFYDAFNPKEHWIADQHLAIDQGPIVVMIENYRTGLIWDTFMRCEEVQAGLKKLGFSWKHNR